MTDPFFTDEMYESHPEIFPLEEKIHMFFKDEVAFTYADVEARFPDEHSRAIYRALKKLEDTRRIRFVRHVGRKKAYTASGQSNLPMFKFSNGEVKPISVLLDVIDKLYDENGRVLNEDLDRLYILLCQLFVVAQGDGIPPVPNKKEFIAIHKELVEIRSFLQRTIENIDAVIRHPAMQGNMELFQRSFSSGADVAIPKPEKLLAFRRWLAKLKEIKGAD